MSDVTDPTSGSRRRKPKNWEGTVHDPACNVFPVPTRWDYPAYDGQATAFTSFGHHRPWCCSEANERGASVRDHGAFCQQIMFIGDAVDRHRKRNRLVVHVARRYTHGEYQGGNPNKDPDLGYQTGDYVVVGPDEDAEEDEMGLYWLRGHYMTPAAARSLAAALVRSADQLER